ncbi:helix-turn-helix domain-containing protein [Streptomyces erythrochromogenes]|uniref:helix-turn-helix domain-containing protein n=1 Tax=Streptomyces erythrochromogenes TaxID=285574 RepID=UPI0038687447|nr:helix-turn-helix domain-containing protein [Streptomyces erythrochromogenes]
MSARIFDGQRVRALRRSAELTQEAVATAVGVHATSVTAWERGTSHPDPERLPALARALGQSLGELFPRDGLPTLADLRADAGYFQNEVPALLGTKSAGPVANAERAKRRLSGVYVEPLAKAYGVSVEQLMAAQERSFGVDVPEPHPEVPTSLADKMRYLMDNPGDDQVPPSDAEIARAVNEYVGARVISASGVADLRTGEVTEASPPVLEGLSAAFGVSALFFRSRDVVKQQVAEGLTLLAHVKSGSIRGLKGRQMGPEGLPTEVMAMINEMVAEIEERGLPNA